MTGRRNLLAGEKSPYLLQHADNPVNWHPWGDGAFRKAREEDKPLFVSIGYATCHWCHVMERESFSDGEVANLLNDACVPVKVDREERPDIDGNFMAVCQMMNGSGGWPLNVFLTPEGLPFFAATYLPKRGTAGRPGMVDMVPRVKWLWKTRREQVMQSAGSIRETLLKEALPAAGPCPGQAQAKAAFDELSPVGWFLEGAEIPHAVVASLPFSLLEALRRRDGLFHGKEYPVPHLGRRHTRPSWRRHCPVRH